ncbi:MAG: hypothetical protein AAF449_01295 [Myxococcota bacterium]
MVRRGEFLERAVVIPHRQATLDGLFHRGRGAPGVVVVPPHPERGSMEIPLIAELAWALARAGHPTLRFNYPGVGASPGDFIESDAVDALRSAVEHMRMSGAENGVVGVAIGWGAEVVAQLDEPWLAMLLIQPPSAGWSWSKRVTGPIRVFIAEGDREDYRRTVVEAASQRPRSRAVVVQNADEAFRAGLVQLGHHIVDALSELSPV